MVPNCGLFAKRFGVLGLAWLSVLENSAPSRRDAHPFSDQDSSECSGMRDSLRASFTFYRPRLTAC